MIQKSQNKHLTMRACIQQDFRDRWAEKGIKGHFFNLSDEDYLKTKAFVANLKASQPGLYAVLKPRKARNRH